MNARADITARSYVDIAANQTPAQTANTVVPARHANIIGIGEMHDRQIIIRGDSALTELTEIELVGKANEAIDLAVKEKSIQKIENPFIGATKMRNRQIIYTAMMKEIAEIIKEPRALAAFQCKFGGLSTAHTRLYYTLVEFVPLLFNNKAQAAKYEIERENMLPGRHAHTYSWGGKQWRPPTKQSVKDYTSKASASKLRNTLQNPEDV
ncbi:hypothetical protein AX17_006447 [Amanita inopinata Kibby_2008]|nr:hypothetical protein AX17_006447 [Amanita inopinata Kibby_2008]